MATGNPLPPPLVFQPGATIFTNLTEAMAHFGEIKEKIKELLDLEIEEKKAKIEKERVLTQKETLLVEKEKILIERERVLLKIEQLKFREMWENYDKNKE